ncbi:hypothetical protein FCV25MIE_22021, partial [Fagus crenata]
VSVHESPVFLDLGFDLLGSRPRNCESEITEEAWMGILGFVEGGFEKEELELEWERVRGKEEWEKERT